MVARGLRPYSVRRDAVGRDLGDAATALAGALDRAVGREELWAALARAKPVTLPAGTVEADTVLGPLWLAGGDEMITPLIQEHGFWEPDVGAYFEECLGFGMRFVDVGANIGYFSVLASGLVGPSGHVYAVEPGARQSAILRANLWRHGCWNASVLAVAGYTQTGHVTFETNPDGASGDWVNPGTPRGPVTLVPAAALDDLLAPGPVHGIKIDAQGADHLVLRGMAETLAASPDVRIVVEFLPLLPDLYGDSQPEVLALYAEMGFDLFFLTRTGRPYPVSADEVLGSDLDVLNLCLQRP